MSNNPAQLVVYTLAHNQLSGTEKFPTSWSNWLNPMLLIIIIQIQPNLSYFYSCTANLPQVSVNGVNGSHKYFSSVEPKKTQIIPTYLEHLA